MAAGAGLAVPRIATAVSDFGCKASAGNESRRVTVAPCGGRSVRWAGAGPPFASGRGAACTSTRATLDAISKIRLSGGGVRPVSYTHLRAHETGRKLVCRLL